MTNEYDIIVTYRNGVIFKMGNWSDVEYKLDLARTVMEDENIKGKKGYLQMIGKNQCSFRSSGENEIIISETTSAEDMENISTETTAIPTESAEMYGF